MRKRMVMMTLVLALVAGACAADANESDEYQALVPVRDRGFEEMNILVTQEM